MTNSFLLELLTRRTELQEVRDDLRRSSSGSDLLLGEINGLRYDLMLSLFRSSRRPT